MTTMSLEVEWQKVISSPRLERSLFSPTEYCSLKVFLRHSLVWCTPELPYEEFSLYRFELDGVGSKTDKFEVFLDLVGEHKTEGQVSARFRVIWKSKYFNAKKHWVFTYRPNAIFVKLDSESSRLPFNFDPRPKKGPGPGKKIALPRYPKHALQGLKHTMFLPFPRVRKKKSPDPKYGFNRELKPKYPIEVMERVNDATYTSNVPYTVLSGERDVQRYYKNIVGTTTPGFKNKRPKKLPVNPVAIAIYRTQDRPGYLFTEEPSTGFFRREYYGTTAYTYYTPPSFPSFDSNVRNRCLSKVEERTGTDINANIAQDIAQFGQLNKLILGTVRRLTRSITAVKHGNLGVAIDQLSATSDISTKMHRRASRKRAVADQWLELQYGWKPMMQDIEGLMRLLSQVVTGGPVVQTVRAQANSEKRYTLNQGPFLAGSTKLAEMEVIEKFHVKVGIRYTYSSRLVTYLQQLGFTNPINLAWEVLPYSFVADWFLPIGPYLSSVSAYQGLSFMDGYLTQHISQDLRGSFEHERFAGTFHYTAGGSYERNAISISREKLSDFPRKELPHPKNGVSIGHTLNAIALMTSAFTRGEQITQPVPKLQKRK